jgi:hypothetical protein
MVGLGVRVGTLVFTTWVGLGPAVRVILGLWVGSGVFVACGVRVMRGFTVLVITGLVAVAGGFAVACCVDTSVGMRVLVAAGG